MRKLLDSILWQPLRGSNGVTQMHELAEYLLVILYPVFIFARAISLHAWDVDLYPVTLAQTHLAAIIGIAGVLTYKTIKKNETRPTDSKKD